MLNQSIVKDTTFHSVLSGNSIIAPEGEKHSRSIVADLLLTTLIDAFAILVIFLLMSFSSTGDVLYVGKGMELPKAAKSEELERFPVVKLEGGKLFVEDKEVAQDQLVQALLDLRTKFQETNATQDFPAVLTVQADRRAKYESLNSIVLASSQAGYSDIKFAVVMK